SDTTTPRLSTLSLHDALPISSNAVVRKQRKLQQEQDQKDAVKTQKTGKPAAVQNGPKEQPATPLPRTHLRKPGHESDLDLKPQLDRKSTRLNSSHVKSSYAVF